MTKNPANQIRELLGSSMMANRVRVHLDELEAQRDNAVEALVRTTVALRYSGCSCWDHVCKRCQTLDDLYPGWRENPDSLEERARL